VTGPACCTRRLRRLAAKTQVLSPASPADFARNRLTHSLEVAQVGRELAIALELSPDVVDTACLSHDIGHPPFGHNGERALNDWAEDIGGFEGNAQTLRILSRLEPKVLDAEGRSAGSTSPVRASTRRASTPGPSSMAFPTPAGARSSASIPRTRPSSAGCDRAPGRVRCIEAEVMDLSDDIAYSVHDFEDAVLNGYLDPARLADVREHEALLTAIQAWVGFGFTRDELADALYRLTRIPEWLPGFDGSRAALAGSRT
jgi:dGTPase